MPIKILCLPRRTLVSFFATSLYRYPSRILSSSIASCQILRSLSLPAGGTRRKSFFVTSPTAKKTTDFCVRTTPINYPSVSHLSLSFDWEEEDHWAKPAPIKALGEDRARINFSSGRAKINPTALINPEKIKTKAILFLGHILGKIREKQETTK